MEMFAGQPTVMGRKGKDDDLEIDLEAGGISDRLYPGIGYGENQLRWGFIRKVYGILCAQILLTTIVSSLIVLYPPISTRLQNTPSLGLAFAILPFVLLIPLYHYQQKHPLNFVFLGPFTICLSLSVGVACANTSGEIVFQALVLTSAVVVSLTGYTFWASRKGKDFSFLGPFLFAGITILVLTSFIQMFFPFGSTSSAVIAGVGAFIFCGYLIYDTDNLIKRFNYDEYIWASVILYLDILNLFITILNLLRSSEG